MRELAPGIYRFEDGGANWYAVEDHDRLLLIDSGWPRGRPAVEAGLAAIGRAPRDVRALLLTHAHADHLGSARWLEQEHSVPVYAHPDELERVRGHRPATRSTTLLKDLWRPHAVAFIISALRRGILSPEWPQSARSIAELDCPLQSVPTPGHTEGHAAYVLAQRRIAFTGDALVTMNVLTGRRGPQLHPAAFQVDMRQAAETLGVLAELDVTLVLPGHGEPYHGSIARAVEAARAQ